MYDFWERIPASGVCGGMDDERTRAIEERLRAGGLDKDLTPGTFRLLTKTLWLWEEEALVKKLDQERNGGSVRVAGRGHGDGEAEKSDDLSSMTGEVVWDSSRRITGPTTNPLPASSFDVVGLCTSVEKLRPGLLHPMSLNALVDAGMVLSLSLVTQRGHDLRTPVANPPPATAADGLPLGEAPRGPTC